MQKGRPFEAAFCYSIGAGNRIRTYDLRITNAPLYQLSYSGDVLVKPLSNRVDAAYASLDS